ncbi:hypothetical protein BGW80DRAFT_640289 [Lactifluus volemus]|nr:hypothetical protein BGW80DRAFT_640289 [Lactifluus volemus]
MKAFRDFVKGFKPKYRIAHDRSLGLPTASPAVVEVLLYEGYLRRMRITGEVNLNLDCPAEFVNPCCTAGRASRANRSIRSPRRPDSQRRAPRRCK